MKKLLFSPGPVASDTHIKIDFHHRSDKFHELYEEKADLIRDQFFDDSYDVIFTQGSGTSAIETAINGLTSNKKVLVLTTGTFSERMYSILDMQNLNGTAVTTTDAALKEIVHGTYDVFMAVCFETSKSTKNDIEPLIKECNNRGIISIVDMVSALGYYPPTDATVICSSTAKILRGIPVLGILAYKKWASKHVDPNRGYYLNMARYIQAKKNRETPHTSMIPQLLSINPDNFTNPGDIVVNCHAIQPNSHFEIVGDRIAPVLTLKFASMETLNRVIESTQRNNIELYYNKVYMNDSLQIGMFNHTVDEYRYLNTIIQDACNR